MNIKMYIQWTKEDLHRKVDFSVIFLMQSSLTLCKSLGQCLPKGNYWENENAKFLMFHGLDPTFLDTFEYCTDS